MKALHMRTNEYGVTDYSISEDRAALSTQRPYEQDNLKPNTDYACILVEIPEGWELGDKPPQEMPDGECRVLDTFKGWINEVCQPSERLEHCIHIYPKAPEQSKDVPPDGYVIVDEEWQYNNELPSDIMCWQLDVNHWRQVGNENIQLPQTRVIFAIREADWDDWQERRKSMHEINGKLYTTAEIEQALEMKQAIDKLK